VTFCVEVCDVTDCLPYIRGRLINASTLLRPSSGIVCKRGFNDVSLTICVLLCYTTGEYKQRNPLMLNPLLERCKL
jgi:hypothetical protein